MSPRAQPLSRELRIQMVFEPDQRRRAQTRRVGRCEACGQPVLSDDDRVLGPVGPLHAACSPFKLLAKTG